MDATGASRASRLINSSRSAFTRLFSVEQVRCWSSDPPLEGSHRPRSCCSSPGSTLRFSAGRGLHSVARFGIHVRQYFDESTLTTYSNLESWPPVEPRPWGAPREGSELRSDFGSAARLNCTLWPAGHTTRI